MSENSAMMESEEKGKSLTSHIRNAAPVSKNISSHGSALDDASPDEMQEILRRGSNVSSTGRNTLGKEETPSIWVGYDVLALLFFLGLATGVINGCIAWLIKLLSTLQARIITSSDVGPLYFLIFATFLCALSAFIIKKGGMKATYGAGMPEVKALLVSDFHLTEFPSIVSAKIFFLRVSSLIIAAGSGLSIGVAAPLVHAALCTAYCFMRFIGIFRHLMDNPAMLKQIFAAAAAVGMSTVFNAPVGGLLFSIEVTSTYYLISNYWRSFMAATTGAVMYNIFITARDIEGRILQIDTVSNPYSKWEYFNFILLGVVSGVFALGYLKFHQACYMAIRKYVTDYPIVCAALAGAISSVIIYALGAHSRSGVSEMVIVKDLFQSGLISEMDDRHGVSRIGGLFASLTARTFLTIIGTTQRISAGVFLPMFTIGALVGRIFGQIVNSPARDIYVAGYAMVGASAFLSGTTHTISAAVIVVEMTGEIDMLLPCLIGAVIACGITKSRSLSLYDQGMVNKGLESFELLLEATGGFNFASDVMDRDVVSVSSNCTVADLFLLLTNMNQTTFPVIDNAVNNRLIGSVDRRDVYRYLRDLFTKQGEWAYIQRTLAADCKTEELAELRSKQVEEHNSWLQRTNSDAVPGASIARMLFPSSYSLNIEVGNSSVDSGWGGQGVGETGLSPAGNPLQKSTTRAALTLDDSAATVVDIEAMGELSPTSSDTALVKSLQSEKLDLLHTPGLPMNGFPFTAHKQSTMEQLYVLFEMVKVKTVFVVAEDKTVEGMISKQMLLKNLKNKVN